MESADQHTGASIDASEIAGRTVAVIGQGYVGLPMAQRAVAAGMTVIGFDVDTDRVRQLATASSFIDDVSDEQLATMLATGRYQPTSDPDRLAGFDVAVVSVPTPLRDRAPDLTYVEDAARTLAGQMGPRCLVILESTTYPGTTADVFVPLLEKGSGLLAGEDFMVGYSPERIDPSNPTWGFRNTPKIVAGLDDASSRAVAEFYALLVDEVVPVSTIREAELAKLFENTFRHVNIALVNELAMACQGMGIDVWSVLDAAATKPFGFMRFTPGPGVGGHCLPIDPSYLSWQFHRQVGKPFRFIEIANDINEHMPDYVVERVAAQLNDRKRAVNGSDILVLGLTYKRNSGDARQSPATDVVRKLLDRGARIRAVDALIQPSNVPAGVQMVPGDRSDFEASDLVLILTDHDGIDWAQARLFADRVLDTRNRLAGAGVNRL
jgi:UDP-N-acetyl-D-mannosaminuronic acid dehydrogenase/UDP-N-acetyl-D-glucosamine dehydrogenase